MEGTPKYSLVIPLVEDQTELNMQVKNLCTAIDRLTDASYEIVSVDRSELKSVTGDTERVRGEVLIIIDGDLSEPPALLNELISSFEKGADLAVAGHYGHERSDDKEPSIICFGIRRTALPQIETSPEGFGLALDILGPEAMQQIAGNRGSQKSEGHMATYLKHLVGVDK